MVKKINVYKEKDRKNITDVPCFPLKRYLFQKGSY